jgi:hypothetical protein
MPVIIEDVVPKIEEGMSNEEDRFNQRITSMKMCMQSEICTLKKRIIIV